MISKGLPDEWPPEVVEVAAQLQQGDLISEPPLVYAASLAYPIWALTRLEAEDGVDSDPVHLSLDRDDVPEWGIVVSQTCDVTEEEHEPVQPWVEVCPVYERDAVENAPEYLYPLNRMPAAEGRMWVADLRLTVSLEKGLLVGRQRRDPFDGAEEARIEFGVKLGERRARPALSAGVHVVITETLKKRRRSGGRVRVSRIWLFCMESCVGDSSGGRGDRGAGRRGRRRGVALDGGADRGVGAAVGAELE